MRFNRPPHYETIAQPRMTATKKPAAAEAEKRSVLRPLVFNCWEEAEGPIWQIEAVLRMLLAILHNAALGYLLKP